MCGIVGFSGFDGMKYDPASIKILMSLNILRGSDAAGFFRPLKDVKFEKCVYKDTDRADKNLLINYKSEIEQSANIFIGHLRQASFKHKTFSKDTTHPFYFPGIIGVHNGTITNIDDLKKKYDKIGKFNVDSAHVYDYISKYRDLHILNDIAGAATLLFSYENEEDTLHLFKKDREIHIGWKEEGMYISSEKQPLQIIGCTNIEELKELNLYTIKHGVITENKKLANKPYHDYTYTYNNTFKNSTNSTSVTTSYMNHFTSNESNIISLTLKYFNSLKPEEKKNYLKDSFNDLFKESVHTTERNAVIYNITLKNKSKIYSRNNHNINEIIKIINENLNNGDFVLRYSSNELMIDVNYRLAEVKINTFLKAVVPIETIKELIINACKKQNKKNIYQSEVEELKVLLEFYVLTIGSQEKFISDIKDEIKKNNNSSDDDTCFNLLGLPDIVIDKDKNLFGIIIKSKSKISTYYHHHEKIVKRKIHNKTLQTRILNGSAEDDIIILFNNGQISAYETTDDISYNIIYTNETYLSNEDTLSSLKLLSFFDDDNISKNCITLNHPDFKNNLSDFKEVFKNILSEVYFYEYSVRSFVIKYFINTEFAKLNYLYNYKNKNKIYILNQVYENHKEETVKSLPAVVEKVRAVDVKIGGNVCNLSEIPTFHYSTLLKNTKYEKFFVFKNNTSDLDTNIHKEKLYFSDESNKLFIIPISKVIIVPHVSNILPKRILNGNFLQSNLSMVIDSDISTVERYHEDGEAYIEKMNQAELNHYADSIAFSEDIITDDELEDQMENDLSEVLEDLENDDYLLYDKVIKKCTMLSTENKEKIEEIAYAISLVKEQLLEDQIENKHDNEQIISLLESCEDTVCEIERNNNEINSEINSQNPFN
jgi:predicted glutamine amidotransferase